MTPEEKIARFLVNLSNQLEARHVGTSKKLEILCAVAPVVTEFYLKGQ